ncbi:hypothetical protein OCGS_2065 [Oceaniovalibus guishaninsula JLT2003]|uniref:Thiol:disulfide interchange protein DsbD N-terminal domain-containing protein n=1 Tax=Oceaniovalibus guishaninsula JLT2003 TaxID=1231392 RepID=K2GLY7_9RHOB|nr:protein-disulfide reductase DsbD domain-containing protein [Oceaniovalibus guishaninsula]EKE43731.1 hypothetical protein OCGS_2065 [Oceaniovalibus guishaninsula JLT2003]
MTRRALSAALACLVSANAPAHAQDGMARVDLLPGWRADGRHFAALRITLAPGWKTYWRSPGDAGIPPHFDWSGSGNLQSIRVHWPVPHVFGSNGLTSIGYADGVVLPVEIVPNDPGAPIDLSLALDLGVCEDICVPFSATLAGTLDAGPVRPDARIRAALADRPLSKDEAGVGQVDCTLAPTADGMNLTATFAMARRGRDEFAVIETADPSVWVSQAETRRDGATLAAMAEIVPPPGDPLMLDRSGLRITVLDGGGAVEIRGCD